MGILAKKEDVPMSTPVQRFDRPVPIREVAALWPLNLDFGAAFWALKCWGETLFPGIRDAAIVFWNGHETPDGRPADEWVEDGVLAVNCGGGILDHHPHEEFVGECAFTRTLDLLGLGDDPFFEEVKQYVLWDDTRVRTTKGARPAKDAGAFTLGRFFKDLQESAPTGDADQDQQRVMECVIVALKWLFQALDAYYLKQVNFFGPDRQAFEAARVETVRIGGQDWKIVTGENDCDGFARYARSKHGCHAHVVIQRRPTSHVQISTAAHARLRTDHLAELVRLEEQYRRAPDGRAQCVDGEKLRQDGMIEEVPEWYYLRADQERTTQGSGMLLNGTRRHCEIEPTRISLEKLVEIVKKWMCGPHSRPHWSRGNDRQKTRTQERETETTNA